MIKILIKKSYKMSSLIEKFLSDLNLPEDLALKAKIPRNNQELKVFALSSPHFKAPR